MCEFSEVDGFAELAESLAEMIKLVANEPSMGLFYIQQHTQSAVPNLIDLQNNVVDKSREISLHTEDVEDSIAVMRSMKECGFPIADEMIRDIKNSLSVISTKQPKRGSIKSSFWGQPMWARNTGFRRGSGNGESSAGPSGYISNVFWSAKQKATNFKWAEHDYSNLNETEGKKTSSYRNSAPSITATSNSSKSQAEAEELPLPSQLVGDSLERLRVGKSLSDHELLSLSEKYEEFKALRETKLQEWLGEDGP